MNENNFPPKKSITRKKLVDLKAVAALLDDGEGGSPTNEGKKQETDLFSPDEELIQATRRIKSQRDIINSRITKMMQSREKASKGVFDKVHRDYSLQLDSITKLLNEKKALLMRELKNLYMLREKQNIEINRHKEILEEARFRHFLEEFSEEQFKEVEEFESREIVNLQADLANINSTIRVHEELFDAEDLNAQARSVTSAQASSGFSSVEATKTMARAAPAPPPATPRPTPEHRPMRSEAQKYTDDFGDKTPQPASEPAKEKEDLHLPEPDSIHVQTMDPLNKGYFAETSETSIKAPSREETDKTVLREGVKATSSTKEAESIFDVLGHPAPEREVSQTASQSDSSTAPVDYEPESASAPLPTGETYKLVFVESEGDLDMQECPMKDNISIGRSPSNDIVLKNPKVSRQHAAINKYKDQYIIIDLKSSNGVFVNGRKVEEQGLEEGDEISIGGYKMKFVKG